jgi:hypothetical protein
MKEEEKKEEENMEQWNDVKSKNNTPIIIILVLIIIGLGVFIFLNKDKLFEKVESNSNNVEEKNSKDTSQEENNVVENNTTNNETEVKPLDLTKCLNCGSNWVISEPSETSNSTNFTLSNNNNNLTLAINWATFCKVSGASACSTETLEYEIRGVTKNVKSTIVGGSGQSINSTTFYYLLEDGTVEYTKLYNKNTDSQGNSYYSINYSFDNTKKDSQGNSTPFFASQGRVSNVNDIIKLYNVQVHENNGGGHATTIGAKADGSFYDLKVE